MAVKLFVGNLSGSITSDELRLLFTKAGKVILADIPINRRNGDSRGFAFVTMGTQTEAEKAIHMFNTYSLNEKEIIVDVFQSTYDF
ncbi:MAG: RNA-binding protein [Anaerolineales bacterium]|nr:RNA-binding protein [Anaerolineales bacterium]